MDEAKLNLYKEKLLKEKKETEKAIQEFGSPVDLGDFPGNEDEVDESTLSFEQGAKETTMRQRLSAIESALARMERGTYGVCDVCQGIIEDDILDIVPESHLCRSCKMNAHEK